MVKVVNFMLYYVTLTFTQKVVNEPSEGTKNTDLYRLHGFNSEKSLNKKT